MWKWMLVALCAWGMMGSWALAEETVLWKADLSQIELGQPAPGFDAKLVVQEDGGKRFLSLAKEKGSSWVFEKATAAAQPAKWDNYEFRFTARFHSAPAGLYTFVKANGSRPEVKYMWCYVNIRTNSVSFTLHGVPKDQVTDAMNSGEKKYTDVGLEPLKQDVWYPFVIRVQNKTVTFFRGQDGKMVEVSSFETAPGTGGVGILSYVSVDLADMEVVALPKTEDAVAPKPE